MDDYELYHYGDYDNAIGTANISSISDIGRVTGYTNFKPR